MRTLSLGLSALIVAAWSLRAQETIGFSGVEFDAEDGTAYGWAQTHPDYSTYVYYNSSIEGGFHGHGPLIDSQVGTPAGFAWEDPLLPGDYYETWASHSLELVYQVYEMDPYCYGSECYKWWDALGCWVWDPWCNLGGQCEEWETPYLPSGAWTCPENLLRIYVVVTLIGYTVEAQTAPNPVVNCNPSSVTRGGNMNCSVSGVAANYVSAWRFEGGGGNATGSGGVRTWGGTMAQGGTVYVDTHGVTAWGTYDRTGSRVVGVNARSGWATSAVGAQNGTVSGCSFTSPPPGSSTTLGCSTYAGDVGQFSLTTLPNGPNTGFAYYTSNVSISQSFPWQIHPDVNNTQSDFALHQYGSCGYISASNLKTNVTWHESSSTPRSHYAQYLASLQSNNFGTYFEPRVATPQQDKPAFNQSTRNELVATGNTIHSDAGSEASLYGPNYNQSTGAFQGYINYPSYAPCP